MSTSPPPRRRLEPDTITALAAVAIGVCALGVSLYQATIMRQQQGMMVEQNQMAYEQQRASVWPNLEVGSSYPGDEIRLILRNSGIGPARVGQVRVTVDSTVIPRWTDLITAFSGEREIAYIHSAVGDRVLSPGESLDVLLVDDDALADSIQTNIERVTMEVCYCSVYDECWLYTQDFGDDGLREPVPQCDAASDDFEQ